MIYNPDRQTLQLTDKLYFSNTVFNAYQNDFWLKLYDEADYGGKFYINIARRLNPNRFVSRDSSEWSTPWPMDIIPKYKMVDYDPSFNLDFEEVCNKTALTYKARINQGEKFAIMYSGGIDSTVIMVALLKNLSSEELKSIAVCTSITGIIENYSFFNKYIRDKFTLLDSLKLKYDDIINLGYTPVTADDGDCIFGTIFGINLYYSWEKFTKNMSAESKARIGNLIHRHSDPSVHYSEFKDLLIAYFALPTNPIWPQVPPKEPFPDFGRLLYEKYNRNAQTTTVPVNSLHDFFWWLIFNVKMLNCGIRGALYFNDSIDANTAIHKIENWYLDPLYQRWSMSNNNNGQKILGGAATYKQAARKYIYSLDNNDWYKTFKLKLESMALPVIRQDVSNVPLNYAPNARFGIDTNYNLLSINDKDVQDYIRHHICNYKVDWC
jgi:hypothetical protein